MTAIEHLIQQPRAGDRMGLAAVCLAGRARGSPFAAALYARRSAADVRYVVAAIGLSLMLTMPTVTALQTWRAMTDGAPTVITQSVSNDATSAKRRHHATGDGASCAIDRRPDRRNPAGA